MDFPVSTPLFLAVVGVVLIAWESTRVSRNPLLAMAGLTFGALAVLVRLFSSSGMTAALTGLSIDFGIAFLAGAAVMMIGKRSATPIVIIGLAALLAGGLGRAVASLRSDSGDEETPAALLVELGEDDVVDEIAGTLTEYDASYEKAFPTLSLEQDADLSQVYLVRLPEGATFAEFDRLRAALESDVENVDFVESNRSVALEPPVQSGHLRNRPVGPRLANDPLSGSQWSIDGARINDAHGLLSNVTPARKGVVAILDTGVDARHEDIRGTFLASPASDDAHGHGTHCAGIAGAATNNGVGIASLNWEGNFVEISSYRALSSSGMGTIESIAQAIIDATTDGADVISMSLGDYSPRPPRVITEAVDFALKRQVIVVAAAGNSNQDGAFHMPANIEGVIAVAAVDSDLRKARFSNTNTTLKRPIAAPGVDILSLVPDGGYETKSGTSMATPLVAGLLGVMRSIDPSITADEAYKILVDTGQEVTDSRIVGRVIDAGAALQATVDAAAAARSPIPVAIAPVPPADASIPPSSAAIQAAGSS